MLRNGYNDRTIKIDKYEIVVREAVRNHSDVSYSVIVTETLDAKHYLLIKRYSNIKTKEQEEKAIEKAKIFVNNLLKEK